MEEINKLYSFIKSTFGVSQKQLIEQNRKAEQVFARRVFIVVARDELGFSWNKIGRLLNRDHTTIIHLYKTSDEDIFKYVRSFGHVAQRPGVRPNEHLSTRWGAVLKQRGYKCELCGFNDVVEIHHLIEKSLGGSNDFSNLIVLCPNHHTMIHAQLVHINPAAFPQLAIPVMNDLSTLSTGYTITNSNINKGAKK